MRAGIDIAMRSPLLQITGCSSFSVDMSSLGYVSQHDERRLFFAIAVSTPDNVNAYVLYKASC